jgi:hypothetical protein
MAENVFKYCIDDSDIIVSFSSNWTSFGRANKWGGKTSPENVVGISLWDFIQGKETQHLYKELFRRVRSGMSIGPIPFRCDSPQERRFLNLILSPFPNGQVAIISKILRTESREPIRLLDKDAPRTSNFIKICSMCKKILTHRNEWVEIEEGLRQLRIFEYKKMPNLTHGLCTFCYNSIISDLNFK